MIDVWKGISRIFCGVLLAAAIMPVWAQDVFSIGVAPHTSARVILEMYQPLRSHLEKSLGMPVEVQTAPDFTEFAKRALNQQYDIAITTGHQARLLQTDAQYMPLLTYKADFKAVAIVAKGSKAGKAADLLGTKVIGLSPSSLVTLWGMHWLKNNGGASVPVTFVSAADSVAQLILAGDASAGFVSLANLQKLPPEVQARLRILAESDPLAGRVYVLNARRNASKAQIEKALWDFAASPQGQAYFANNKLDGYRKLKKRELEGMDPYAAEVRKTLSQ